MTDRTDNKSVGIYSYQPIDRLTRKLALEIAPTTLKRTRGSHLLSQVLQNMMRITVQTINNIRKINNNSPSTNNLNLRNRNLKTLP